MEKKKNNFLKLFLGNRQFDAADSTHIEKNVLGCGES